MRILLAVILIGIWSSIYAQNVVTKCMECHSDETLAMDRNGKNVSLFVNQDNFKNSVHGSLECTDCHTGFDPESIPHKEGKNISKVDCAQCHDTKTFSNSIHAANNVNCYSCHTKHNIQPAQELAKTEVNLCVKCHNTPFVKTYTNSIHYQQFIKGAKAPMCVTCHNGSAHAIKAADFSKKDEEVLCAACHKTVEKQFAKSIHHITMQEGTPGCVSCHGAHEIFSNKYSISSQACLKCHLDKSKFSGTSLVKFVQNYQTSVHSRIGESGHEAAACVDCHDNHMIVGTTVSESKIARDNIPVTCGKCHQNELTDYKTSTHAKAFFTGIKIAPTCTDCHGEHTISAIAEKSPLNKIEIHKMCFNCHVNNPAVTKITKTKPEEILNYEQSVHFEALKNGNVNAATCSDCHSAHKMQAPNVSTSKVATVNIPNTCGSQGCHPTIAAEYNSSIHANAIRQGIKDAPTCITCHGNHQIFSTQNPKSRVGTKRNVVLLCSSCHSDVQMNEKYGLPVGKPESYLESYHGLAVRGGSKFAADCASCHGAHSIKPSSDPTSPINRNNLSVTCGKCHPGANITANFKQVHITGTIKESALLYWITYIYVILIISIIGLMFIHNLLDFIRKRQEKKAHKKEIEELKKNGKVYLRMSLGERIQHFIMLTSFIILSLTGFALKYPEAWWVIPVRGLLGDTAFQARSITHRIFGITMLSISIYHFGYLLFTKRGRQLLVDFLPVKKDLTDFIVNIKYLIGTSKEKPLFDRFSYMEKAEYWALVWGVIIMSGTGLILMFNTYFLSIAPKILLDSATLIHLFEAWLATLAIVVWHFYFVIFNPEVYPLNKAFIKGTLSEEEMEHEHPLELEKIKESELKKTDEK